MSSTGVPVLPTDSVVCLPSESSESSTSPLQSSTSSRPRSRGSTPHANPSSIVFLPVSSANPPDTLDVPSFAQNCFFASGPAATIAIDVKVAPHGGLMCAASIGQNTNAVASKICGDGATSAENVQNA